jgi:hypothetical protein
VIAAADETLLGEAWAAALIVYAELTCTDPPERAEPAATTHGTGAAAPAANRQPAIRTLTTPTSADPVAGDAAARAAALNPAIVDVSFVAGHLRRLTHDQTASPPAARAAARAGIELPPGYTWVRPHDRGPGTVRTIRWPPTARLW